MYYSNSRMQLQSPQNAGWKRPGNRRQHQRNICLCIGDAIFCDKPILVRERRSGAVIFGHGNIIHYWEDVTRHNRVSFGSTCQTSSGSSPAPIRGEYCGHVTCSPPITAHLGLAVTGAASNQSAGTAEEVVDTLT